MSCAQAFQALRSSSRSFAARHVARSCQPSAASRGVTRVRHYSAGSAESSGESKTDELRAEEIEKDEVTITPEHALLEKIKQKEAEASDLKSRLRYLQADFLNLQRNAAREKEQTRDFAITKFAGDLLETVDVLAMALKSVPQSTLQAPASAESSSSPPTPAEKSAEAHLWDLHQGVEMTHRLLLSTLFKYHVKPFDPTGEKFDPNRHEALYQAPIPDKEPGSVLECQKTGYTIKDRVLRAAQVGVVQDTS
ncbi:GrpE-domain-containing protein [Irpex rosettiformis]|uniref:GrpE-domain-containing protein n=1 Tax=Irpex rosettiformis TaxID=378272 RepID=A0ACB8UH57_9APHY|nr:GrpE-domain-containing protein [Irpex rosettiformis]